MVGRFAADGIFRAARRRSLFALVDIYSRRNIVLECSVLLSFCGVQRYLFSFSFRELNSVLFK